MEGASYQQFSRVKIRELKEDYAKFEFHNTDASMANTLHRVMITKVPTIIINLVKIEVKYFILNDKFIAHRLVEFHLRAKCMSDQILDVTSKDLYNSDHTVVPVNFIYSAGYESSKQRYLNSIDVKVIAMINSHTIHASNYQEKY
ncbi:hypothetical protein J1N35_011239 [Gossypium stocksii]|uniref:DNA-directed RNA polymerase RpoA/D/Rpb3-type domain-containing protein n=1 Tax=Gossypium stocksii TaxID=47602 RepID=A0A9D3W1X5_9ROSI|nr:hypothetical protein J1N35_011239 [Gossypium stocksii]